MSIKLLGTQWRQCCFDVGGLTEDQRNRSSHMRVPRTGVERGEGEWEKGGVGRGGVVVYVVLSLLA